MEDGFRHSLLPQGSSEGGMTETLGQPSQPSTPMTSTSSVRRLTPVECERLMGWPDGHTIATGWPSRKTSERKSATSDGLREPSSQEPMSRR